MTKETLEKAKMLERQINRIDCLIAYLSINDWKQTPPIRDSGFAILPPSRIRGEKTSADLNEGEVVTIIEAFKSKKAELEYELRRL